MGSFIYKSTVDCGQTYSKLVDIRTNLWWAMLDIVTFIADIISLMFSDNKK